MRKLDHIGLPLAMGYAFAAFFAAWASYRIHVLPIEADALSILGAVVNLEGRAPDQYRILPYLIIAGLTKVLDLFQTQAPTLRIAVLVFYSVFLWLSSLFLLGTFRRSINHNFLWIIFLIYPFLMFDGYRPISSFILFLSVCTVALMQNALQGNRYAYIGFICLIVLLSFSRADVAFVFALASIGCIRNGLAGKLSILAIPVAVQLLLSNVIFSDAEYFSNVVMLWINLSGEFLIRSPLLYLSLGLVIVYRKQLLAVLMYGFHHRKFALLALCGYIATLMVIAMPNEFRLFLPLLPLYLWLLEESRQSGTANQDLDPV